MAELTRAILLQTLAGFEEVNRITERERRERLKTMTDAEARAIFDDLCATGYALAKFRTKSIPEELRLKHLIEVRKVFARLSQAMGYESPD